MAAREEKNRDTVVHFMHQHPLGISIIQRPARPYDQCRMCLYTLDPIARVYACQDCSFFLHEHCAELQLYISHPFHPHPLHFLTDPIAILRECSVCGISGSRSRPHNTWYRCEEEDCSFNLHLSCAILKPSNDQCAINDHQVELLQNSHGHSLLVCNKPDAFHYSMGSRYSCTRCENEFGDDDKIYVCLECKGLLDEPCAAHGKEIRHPFHSQHTLTLVRYDVPSPRCCSLCGGGGRNGYFFSCSSCDFCLDVDCANLDVTTKICKTNQGHIQIQPVTHPHPLTQVEVIINMKNFKSCCFACGLCFEDLVYACLSCGILLHKSCADLPSEITNHLHPNHQLELVQNYSRSKKRFSCRVCAPQSTGHFFYNCGQCKFGLDIKCARSAFPLIMSEYHEHALAYIDIETYTFECALCSGSCRQFYFRCLRLDCGFSIHDRCYPSLPPSVKHDCHIHSLTFAAYPIRGVSDDPEEETELYCHACEERLAFDRVTYFCSPCHFVAHVHCVITAIVPYLHKEPNQLAITSNGEELGSTDDSADEEAVLNQLNEESRRLEKEMRALFEKIYELRNRRSRQAPQRKTLRRKFLLEKRDQFYKSIQ